MTVWIVVWVVLMMFWLFGYGFINYNKEGIVRGAFIAEFLIPWLCVLILGLVVFGAVSPGTIK